MGDGLPVHLMLNEGFMSSFVATWSKVCGRRHPHLGKRYGYCALPFSLRRGTHYDFNIAAKKRQAIHQLALREAAKLSS